MPNRQFNLLYFILLSHKGYIVIIYFTFFPCWAKRAVDIILLLFIIFFTSIYTELPFIILLVTPFSLVLRTHTHNHTHLHTPLHTSTLWSCSATPSTSLESLCTHTHTYTGRSVCSARSILVSGRAY